jgi:hypothetical protein
MTQRSFPHLLSHTQAKALARTALADYQIKLTQYAVTVTWRPEQLTSDGTAQDLVADVGFIVLNSVVKGVITVTPADIVLCVNIPMQLKLFENVAIKVVAGELQKCIERARKNISSAISQMRA